MGSSRSAGFCRSPRRLIIPISPGEPIPPAARQGPPRRRSEGRDPARVRGELPRLWRAQGLATVAAGRLQRGSLHGRPVDAEYGPSHASAPDRLWLADFTCVATWGGLVYVAFVIDAYARRIVGWRASRTAHADFVLEALEQALHDRRPASRGSLVHHSDRGAQYVSIKYTERLAEAGIEPWVGSVGDSYDCESVGAARRA